METHRRRSDGRRRFTPEFKRDQLGRVLRGEVTMAELSRELSVSHSLVRKWKQLMDRGSETAVGANEDVVPASEVRVAQQRIRELERALGRKTMEVEILAVPDGEACVASTSLRIAEISSATHQDHRLHSFARLPNGHLIATVQLGDPTVPGAPGGLAEFDGDGKLVRVGWSRDSAFPGAKIRTYAVALVPGSDRIVTTSAPMDTEITANVVQVWRLSDLSTAGLLGGGGAVRAPGLRLLRFSGHGVTKTRRRGTRQVSRRNNSVAPTLWTHRVATGIYPSG